MLWVIPSSVMRFGCTNKAVFKAVELLELCNTRISVTFRNEVLKKWFNLKNSRDVNSGEGVLLKNRAAA